MPSFTPRPSHVHIFQHNNTNHIKHINHFNHRGHRVCRWRQARSGRRNARKRPKRSRRKRRRTGDGGQRAKRRKRRRTRRPPPPMPPPATSRPLRCSLLPPCRPMVRLYHHLRCRDLSWHGTRSCAHPSHVFHGALLHRVELFGLHVLERRERCDL